jgi:hypothetical protein
MSSPAKAAVLAAFALGLLALASCGGDDGPTSLAPPDHDISGTWSCTEIADESGCGGGIDTHGYEIQIGQDGNRLTVQMQGGSFAGSISASSVRWTGEYPDGGGTKTITQLSLTVQPSGAEMTGVMSWRWSDGQEACLGDSEMILVKTARAR